MAVSRTESAAPRVRGPDAPDGFLSEGSKLTRRRGTTYKERDEMTDTQVTWLTQESHDRLKAELDQLIANRPVIAAEINDRREEGDLRENGGYHAAREEQGQQEARIRQRSEERRVGKECRSRGSQ